MEEKLCKNCRYFIQHYASCKDKLIRVYCGHSTFAAPKTKRPDRKACDHSEPGSKDTESFVSKSYLSKKLLEKVLRMELLPEIKDQLI